MYLKSLSLLSSDLVLPGCTTSELSKLRLFKHMKI
jgi:hypothetical protein